MWERLWLDSGSDYHSELAKISNESKGGNDEKLMKSQLQQRRESLRKEISELEEALRENGSHELRASKNITSLRRGRRWIIESGLAHWKAELKWVDDCLNELKH